jgi:benzil reductase ((S)-benzoin forming)
MRLALLTGGSKGLGLALCETLAARGFRVVEFSRTAPHPDSVRLDLSSPDATRHAVAQTLATIDPHSVHELLIVANAATLEPIGPSCRKDPASVVASLSTNLISAILFVSLCVAHFQHVPGRKVIANVSAGVARDGLAGWSLYCAAKAGMESFIKSLALEQQSEPCPFIPVNVDPGVVDTGMHVIAAQAAPGDFPAAGRFAERRASGSLAPPSVAAAALADLLALPTLVPGRPYDVRDISSLLAQASMASPAASQP